MLNRTKSEKQYRKLKELIPGGVNSPVRAFRGLNMTPLIASHAFQDLLVDADGRQYIDYCLSWGALIHGHAHPQIVDAVIERVKKGSSFGCTTEIEGRLAEKIIDAMPSIERIRFVSSGTEATMSALRLARGYTGKEIFIKFNGCYHGHSDQLLVQAGSGVLGFNGTSTSAGIPKEFLQWTACLPFNDIEAFDRFISQKQVKENFAGVIIEPIATNMGLVAATQEFLEHIRRKTKEMKAVLIFDEVVTGFRVGKGGATALYNIEPDLICLGKIIGGGFPAAAFGGKKEIMDCIAPLGTVYQAGTLSGNPVAMEAGLQALTLCDAPRFYEELQRKADVITQPIKEFIAKEQLHATVQQIGSAFTIFFGVHEVHNVDDALKCSKKHFQELFQTLFEAEGGKGEGGKNVYAPPSAHEIWTVSSVHSQANLECTRNLIMEYLKQCVPYLSACGSFATA